MLNPIKINFKLDKTIKRALTTEMMIKSHDINVIEFHILFDGLELTADHAVKVLSVFNDTGSQTNVNCDIVDGKAIYRPDTSIISQYEHVLNYVYVYHGNQSLDVRLFTYSVDSSEIDKTAIKVKTVYDQSYDELLTEFEVRLQDYKDSLPQASDLRDEVDVILDKFKVDSQSAIDFLGEVSTAVEIAEAERKEAELLREENYEQKVDTAIVEADVVAKVDNKVTELAPQINDLTAQLAETENNLIETTSGLMESANGSHQISFKNYLGNYQNMHPKVLAFDSKWNGYKYWMGYTPYPDGDVTQENPSIAVSDDKETWLTPPGLTNPLDDYPGTNGTNSDTHLVYREDTDTLELWWRTYAVPDVGQILYRRTTKDGVTWTEKEAVYITNNDDLISPAIIFEDGKYKIWSVSSRIPTGTPEYRIRYNESFDDTATSWTSPVELNIDYGDFTPWHIDTISTDLGYEMVVSERGNTGKIRDMFYILQKHDGTLTKPRKILEVNPFSFDNNFLYRASLMKEDGKYYLYYSFSNKLGEWGMSLSYGESIFNLKPFPSQRKIIEAPIGVWDNFDVSGVEVIIIPQQSGGQGVTFNSFANAQVGQKILVVCGNSSSKATFKFSTDMWTTDNQDIELDKSQNMVILVANKAGVYGEKVRIHASVLGERKKQVDTVVALAGNEVLTNYDVKGISTFIIPSDVGGQGVVFNSFINAELGQKIHVVCRNLSSKATFKYSETQLWTPNNEDYTISTQSGDANATMVCTTIAGTTRFNVF